MYASCILLVACLWIGLVYYVLLTLVIKSWEPGPTDNAKSLRGGLCSNSCSSRSHALSGGNPDYGQHLMNTCASSVRTIHNIPSNHTSNFVETKPCQRKWFRPILMSPTCSRKEKCQGWVDQRAVASLRDVNNARHKVYVARQKNDESFHPSIHHKMDIPCLLAQHT